MPRRNRCSFGKLGVDKKKAGGMLKRRKLRGVVGSNEEKTSQSKTIAERTNEVNDRMDE